MALSKLVSNRGSWHIKPSISRSFSFTGHSKALALSKFVLSAQDRSGSKRCRPPAHPPRPSVTRQLPLQCQARRTKRGP